MSLIRTASLAIALCLIGINSTAAAPNTDYRSDTLTDLISQLRPPGSNDCPCPFSQMATWTGWTLPKCYDDLEEDHFLIFVKSTDDSLPIARLAYSPFFKENGTCSVFNDWQDFARGDVVNDEQFYSCLVDIDKLARDIGLFNGCGAEFLPE